MGVLCDQPRIGSSTTAYKIDRSLRFNRADSANLTWTPSSAGNRQKWTFSCWIKRTTLHAVHGGYEGIFGTGTFMTGSSWGGIYLDNLEAIYLFDGSVSTLAVTPKYKLKDLSAWYHIVAVCNLTDGASKIYVNGDLQTDMTTNLMGSVTDGNVNNTTVHYLGRDSSGNYFDGYLAECHFVDGSALEAADFGKTDPVTGQWVAKKYTGTHGTNGFYVNFKDNSNTTATTLGKDNSANSNNWTPNNLSVSAGIDNDSVIDTPTNNYCILNRLASNATTLNNGGLYWVGDTGTDDFLGGVGSFGMKSGKWYFEHTCTTVGVSSVGIIPVDKLYNLPYGDQIYAVGAVSYSSYTGGKMLGDASAASYSTYGDTWTTNDVIGVAFDADNNAIWFSKNGAWQDTDGSSSSATIKAQIEAGTTTNAAYTGLTNEYNPLFTSYSSGAGHANFGQRPFIHTPPTGFKALCAANLPDSTIKKGKHNFNTVIYEGDITDNSGTATQTEGGVGFQADLTWIKRRDTTTNSHQLVDSIRGAGKWLESNDTNAEQITNTNGVLTSWNSDGFVLTGGTTNANLCCEDGLTYVAWNWKAGPSVTNTDGSVGSTVRANPNAGFSIVEYNVPYNTGNFTVGHGLNVAPELILAKNRNTDSNWDVYSKSIPNTHRLKLNLDSAKEDQPAWGDTSPTSSVFTSLGGGSWHAAGGTMINYCFTSVEGYSKIGTYTGTNDANGPFVYTGFKPAWVMAKRFDSTSSWQIWDNVRDTDNPVTHRLRADLNNNEDTGAVDVDFCSNGWKLRNTGINQPSPAEYIYIAFAETPFKYATAR